MQVADEGGVRARADAQVHRRCMATEMRDAGAQQRVGQQAHAANFDQDGGVAEENDTVSRDAFTTGRGRLIGHG